jgi:Cysteine-rich CWC
MTIVNEPHDPIIRDKRCVACGEHFACYAGGCWCDTVSLTVETQARLLAQYTDCLCPTCLRQQASPDGR